ncbi:MAG: HupE/UreJ family protein [Sedimenticola sp.]
MKYRISFKAIIMALMALLLPAITLAHTGAGADGALLHELFHDPYHMLGAAGLLAVLALGTWATYAGGRLLWTLALVAAAVVVTGAAIGLA